jgi:DNA-binding transcriptional ArsR family regulator
MFLALADPTRRRLMELLRGGPRAVGDLVAKVEIEQPGVSRHLRILHEAGFVTMTPEKQRRIYALREGPFREIEDWAKKYRRDLEDRLDRFVSLVEKKNQGRK